MRRSPERTARSAELAARPWHPEPPGHPTLPVAVPLRSLSSSDRDHRAWRVLQIAAVALPLAATTYKLFELDRFFLPKELMLHLAAALCAALCLRRVARVSEQRPVPGMPLHHPPPTAIAELHAERPGATWVDLLLVGYLALSTASALAAPNRWLAARALAITLSGAVLFWSARHLARRGFGDAIVGAAGAVCAIAAATALLQAYGIESELFSLNRAPGGTFGNRNFVAHLAAVGAPLLGYRLLGADRRLTSAGAALGLAATTAALVLSRSRGAYLAAVAATLPFAVGVLRARRAAHSAARAGERSTAPSSTRSSSVRLAVAALAVVGGAAGALLIPNTLNWNSDNPYLESVRGVVDYRSGSGQGRLKQWANSARMVLDHPALGVGTGNWGVRYPRFAPDGDPSMASAGNVTANPWPSSDWVAVLSERGPAAFVALGLVFVALAWWAHVAAWRAREPDEILAGGVLGATLWAAVVVGAFDAVLLLATPTFVVWLAAGALAERCGSATMAGRLAWPAPTLRRAFAVALVVLPAAAAVRSGAGIGAMALFSTGRPSTIALAGRLDPGNFRVRLRQAELAAARQRRAERCEHALAARRLYPDATAPRRLAAGCVQRGARPPAGR